MQEDLSFCKYIIDKLANSNTIPTFTSTQTDEQTCKQFADNLKEINECIDILQTYRQRIIYKILDTQI